MDEDGNPYYYSEKYEDAKYEYRHVQITQKMLKYLPKDRLMTENEWRALGIQQSRGWEHYMVHPPEPHVIMFRKQKLLSVERKENIGPGKMKMDKFTG